MVFERKDNESLIYYWKRQNKADGSIGLFCQNCCYRYPEECHLFLELLHPYDRFAENCPDFIPKDYYKPKSQAKCWLKRLEVDPDWAPLPEGDYYHPYYGPFVVCSAEDYWKIVTKHKVYEKLGRKRR